MALMYSVPPLRKWPSASGTIQPPGRNYCPVERLGRFVLRRSGPGRAQVAGAALMIFATGEGVDLAAPMPRHLNTDTRARAETVQAKPLTGLHVGQPQRPIADDPGAQQRRGLHVAEALRDRHAVGFRHGHVFGIAAVDGVAGEQRRLAQIFLIVLAVAAGLIGVVQPGHADPIPDLKPRRALPSDSTRPTTS